MDNKLYVVVKPDADYPAIVAVCSDKARAIEIAEAYTEDGYYHAFVREFTDGVEGLGGRLVKF